MRQTVHVDNVCQDKLDIAIRSLVMVLASTDEMLRQTARRSLVAIGRQAIEPLTKALKEPHQDLRWEAAKALGEIRDPSAAPALVEALEDSVYSVRWLAAQGLINIGVAGAPFILRALIHNPESGWLREGAHHVLRSIADDSLRHVLAPVMRSLEKLEPGTALVPAAQHALDEIESRPDEDVLSWE